MALQRSINKHLLNSSALSYILYPISLALGSFLRIRRYLYKSIFSQYQAPVYIISIGNITIGGSGKTPFTIFLVELLNQNHMRTAVSHRGYKSSLENSCHLISNRDGLLPISDEAGDEAWLIAFRLKGIPVVVGKNRAKAINLLCKTYPDLDCVILDDSFQHLKVKHDLDFIVINEQTGFGNGFVMPAGYLREPVSALKAADALIINKTLQNASTTNTISNIIKHFKKALYTGGYKSDKIYDFYGKEIQPDSITQDKLMLLSAIGNPSGFEASVKGINLNFVKHLAMTDHYSYSTDKARQEIVNAFRQSGAQWLLTTEKDYAKLRLFKEFADFLLILSISFVPDNNGTALLKLIKQKVKSNSSNK